MSLAKLLYAAVFCLALPAMLVFWAQAAEPAIGWPALQALLPGSALAACGLAVLLAGVAALWRQGRGLPMNAFPPPRLATRGVYRWLAHPIYVGFCAICAGVSLAVGSAAGLWLVSPVVMLSCAALVLGYERQDLRRRFGDTVRPSGLHLPGAQNGTGAPGPEELAGVYLMVLLPWLLLYEAAGALGAPPDGIPAYFGWEGALPVWPATEVVYASVYPFVLLAPLLARTRRELRSFAVSGLLATGIGVFTFFLVPLTAPPRPLAGDGVFARALQLERDLDFSHTSFPSFHVAWAFLSWRLYAGRGKSWRLVTGIWAVLIAASCVTTGMHALVDVLAGFALFAGVTRAGTVWEALRRSSERVANSWRQWRLGPVRVISHSFYAGLAGFLGELIVGSLVGQDGVTASALVTGCGLLGAMLWAQAVEGSPRLLRPFGYYGFVAGIVFGALLLPGLGDRRLLLLAAFAVAAPWVQAIGRLRCLVQGCCHGRPAGPALGIRCVHPSSRVAQMAGLAGTPIHPTQLYSILGNVAIGLFLARLWSLHAPLVLVAGLYLVLAGLARFVEESFRGEPQTRRVAGLPAYQWLAITSVLAGAVITGLPFRQLAPLAQFDGSTLLVALALGLLAGLAMGVDAPDSQRRFARLTG